MNNMLVVHLGIWSAISCCICACCCCSVTKLCQTLCYSMGGSMAWLSRPAPSTSVPGESPQSCWLSATPWPVASQAPLSMGLSRQESWSGVPCPPPGDLPNSGIKPVALMSPALASIFLTTSAPWEIRCLLEFTQIQVLWLVVLSNQLIFRCPSALPCFVELCREHAIYKSRCVATMCGAGR